MARIANQVHVSGEYPVAVATNQQTTHVLISYSSTDVAFAERLEAALVAHGRSVWRDKKDIPPSARWAQEIARALNDAEVFVFIISPTSIGSGPCADEIHQATELKKRIIPVVCADVDPRIVPNVPPIPPALAELHWIFFRDQDDFDTSLKQLLETLDTDMAYWHQAAELATRERQWEESGNDPSLLLRDKELTDSERWIVQGASRKPTPTAKQTQFIADSRRAADQRQRRRARVTAIVAAALAVLTVAASVAAVMASIERNRAEMAAREALSHQLAQESSVALVENRPDVALLLAVEGTKLSDNVDTRDSLAAALADNRHLEKLLQIGKPSVAIFVSTLTYSSDGATLFAGTEDGSLLRWDIATGKRREYPLPKAKDVPYINALAVSPNGSAVAYINGDGLWLWPNISVGAPVLLRQEQYFTVDFYGRTMALTFTSPTRFITVSSVCNVRNCIPLRVQLWDIGNTGGPIEAFDLPGAVNNTAGTSDVAALSPDGKTLIESCITCADKRIVQWNLASRTSITRTIAPPFFTRSVAFSGDSRRYAVLSCPQQAAQANCSTVQIWDVASSPGAAPLSIQTKTASKFDLGIDAFALNAQGTRLALGTCLTPTDCSGGKLELWDVSTKPAALEGDPYGGHINPISLVAFSPDNTHLVSVGQDDNELMLWNMAQVDPITRLVRRTPLSRPPASSYPDVPFYQATLSPNEQLLAEASVDSIALYRAADQSLIQREPLQRTDGNGKTVNDKAVYQLSFSQNGKMLAAMTRGAVFFWQVDGQSLTFIGNLRNPSEGQFSYSGFSLSQDGSRVAVVNTNKDSADTVNDSLIELWNLQTRARVYDLVVKGKNPYQMVLSPDGTTIAAAYYPQWLTQPNLTDLTNYYDHDVTLWDTQTGKQRAFTFVGQGHNTAISALAYSANGNVLASLDLYGTVIMWDMQDKHIAKATNQFLGFPQAHPALDSNLYFSADGRYMAVTTGDLQGQRGQPDTIGIWDITHNRVVSYQTISDVLGHGINGAVVDNVLFSQNDHSLMWIVSRDNEGAIYSRVMDSKYWSDQACSLANRRLSSAEWNQLVGSDQPNDVCPNNPAS